MIDKLFTKAYLEKSDGKFLAVASEGVEDREGETLEVEGWELKNFKKNPVLLWSHNAMEPPIGIARNIRIAEIDGKKKLVFEPDFDKAAEIYDKARIIKRMYEEGILKTFSVGFIPIDADGRRYLKQELLEISAVNIPALPTAEVIQRCKSLGIDEKKVKGLFQIETKPYPNEHSCRLRNPDDFQDGTFRSMTREHDGKKYRVIMGKLKGETTMTEQAYRYPKDIWTVTSAQSHCKDHGGSFEPATETGLDVDSTSTFTINYQGEVEENMEEKTKGVVPYKEFPKADENTPWDGAGARDRLFKWAGGGPDTDPNWSKFAQGFAWFDSDRADTIGAYRLPHHDVIGGTVKTVWAGTAAAMAALLGARGGTNIPTGDRKGVYNHLVKHYNQFDKEPPEFKEYTEEELKGLFPEFYKEKHALVDYLSYIREQLDKMCETLEEIQNFYDEIKNTEGDTANKIFMFTGTLTLIHKELQELVDKLSEKITGESSVQGEIPPPELEEIPFGRSMEVVSKEGRVLSEKNRTLISDCISQMNKAISALEELLNATESPAGKTSDNKKEAEVGRSKDGVLHKNRRLLQAMDKMLEQMLQQVKEQNG